jgi:hypothetical protein
LLLLSAPGPGPFFIWTGTVEANRPPSAAEVADTARSMATMLSRVLSSPSVNIHLADWNDLDPAGIGERAVMYGFQHRRQDIDASGDGALVVFSRGTLLSFLMVLSLDGRANTDLRQYARLLGARMAGAAPSGAR